MSAPKLREWWWRRQGLDGALAGAQPGEVLARTGWARSVGGVGPYLTLFARAGTSREQADQAARDCEIHELPAARGCTYVVPASDFALALSVGASFREAEMKTARSLGVTDKEIDKLCAAVLDALAGDALETEPIREAVGGKVRNLGEAGKKKGVTTTLPVALGRLQAAGEIRRVPTNGRFDQQRYAYAQWRPNPLAGFKLSPEEVHVELARRYFSWIGPASVSEFQWFSALPVRACKAAIATLKLVETESGLMHAEDAARLESFRPSREPRYALVSSLDGLVLLRRNLKSVIDEADLNREVLVEKGSAALGGLSDLPNHAIFDRGRLVGLWEYDPATESIAWTSFVPASAALKKAIAQTEEFVRAQLGDARSFSLDSPKSRAPKIAALRAGAGRA